MSGHPSNSLRAPCCSSDREHMLDRREIMRLHIATLFTLDSSGRMLRVNEPGGGPAPRFFLGRTAQGSIWRFRADVDDVIVRGVEALCSTESASESSTATPVDPSIYEQLLARSAAAQRTWTGPAYYCPRELAPTMHTVRITEENAGLLHPHLDAWVGDVASRQPMLAVLEGPGAVSVCASVRKSSRAHEAGVETAPEFRGRGFAALAVAAWAAAVWAADHIPLYSTSWENTTSRALADALGLRKYGTDLHIT